MSRAFKAVLIDLNGTLHIGRREVPGSIKALSRLRESDIQIRFVTNTTKDTSSNILSLLRDIGFDIQQHEVFSSLRAAHQLIKQQQIRPLLLLHPNALPDFSDVEQSHPNAVVVGWAKEAFSYSNMNAAFRILMANPDAPLIAIHRGRYLKDVDDQLSLGPGPFVAGLEYATSKQAQVVGKPSPAFFEAALQDLGVAPADAVMVGDDVQDDVGGAQELGMAGVLVQTGKYLPGDESKHGVAPYATVKDFAAAVNLILSPGS